MNKSIFRVAAIVLVLATAVCSMTSCNKGYGCPTDFSISLSK